MPVVVFTTLVDVKVVLKLKVEVMTVVDFVVVASGAGAGTAETSSKIPLVKTGFNASIMAT